MANPQKRKGDAAEREAAQLLSDLLGLVVYAASSGPAAQPRPVVTPATSRACRPM